jgi:glucose 1-dehydrogenase
MISLDPHRLDGKRALVTGGGRGIGKGCAIQLARAGADVILSDLPGSDDMQHTAQEIRQLGVNCWTIGADVFSSQGRQQLVDDTLRLAERIDILISNPAFSKRGRFLDVTEQDLDRTLEGTFKSGFLLAQSVARHMVSRGGGGKIVFISSVHAEMPYEGSAPYGAAKAALNHLTHSLSVELVGHKINVNGIEPGWIDTPNERKTFSDAVIEAAGKDLPWQRLGTPEDIGQAATFLASDAADYITGVVLPVDGGFRWKDMRVEKLPGE